LPSAQLSNEDVDNCASLLSEHCVVSLSSLDCLVLHTATWISLHSSAAMCVLTKIEELYAGSKLAFVNECRHCARARRPLRSSRN